jgi:N-dimethylarginine dimethylaminohydrolase
MAWCQNPTGVLRKIMLTKPDYYELTPVSDTARDAQDKGFKVDHAVAKAEHAEMVAALEENGIAIIWQELNPNLNWQIYARDWGVMTGAGALVGRFRYYERKGEEIHAEKVLKENGIPVIGHVTMGAFEGGDCWYVDDHTLCVGCGNRSTNSGVEQAAELLKPYGIEVILVEFHSKWNHLDMIFSVIAPKLAVTCSEALPPYFMGFLKGRGYEVLDFPASVARGTTFLNLLPLGNNKVLSLKQNVEVNKAMRAAGLEVVDPSLGQFLMGGGGPHCLTFEIERDPA